MRLARLLNYVDVPRARAFMSQALAFGEAAGDGALVASARFLRGVLACMSGDVVSGMPELELGAEALTRLTGAERGKVAEWNEVSRIFAYPGGTVVGWRANIGHYHGARALGERLLVEAAGDEETLLVLREVMLGLGQAYAALGMPDEAAAMYTRAHERYLRVGHHPSASALSSYELLTVALPYRTEDIAGRRLLAERAEAEWTLAMGAVPTGVPPRTTHLPLLMLEGHWDEAERLARAMSAEEQARFRYRATAHWHLATLARLRGEAGRAWRSVRVLLPAGSATEPGTVSFFAFVLPTQRVAAALALDEKDHTAARAWLEAHDRWLDWSGAVLGRSEGAALWARYRQHTGDNAKAREDAERALVHATAPRQPLALLAAHRLLGQLDTDAERYEDAETHLTAALTLADVCAAPYERALTLLALVELSLAIGNDDAALRLLEEARAFCIPLGAIPALVRADAIATRLTTRNVSVPVLPAGLSAREVDVLQLIAAGQTNREIADILCIAEKTVERHITHILTKTNVANRAAAAIFAMRHGLT
jgi:DNA-binding CsgD family transcriptional regulator/tetratricopeptide (TPR) repeat protein